MRKRAVSRLYTSGMGDLKMRSLAPVRSTRLEIDWSMRAECIGLMFALRSVADIALRQNMGRFFASMTASACSCASKPCWTKSFSSARSVSSSAGLVRVRGRARVSIRDRGRMRVRVRVRVVVAVDEEHLG